jgi:alpha-glucosidase
VRRLALLSVVLLPATASAGWSSFGAAGAPSREGNALVFRSERGIASVSALTPSIVRVRFAPKPAFGRDHSYAVVGRDLGDSRARFEVGAERSTLATASLSVTIRHAPFGVTFATPAGEPIDADDPELGTAFAGTRVRVWKQLAQDDHVYGLGEKAGRLDKRGWSLGGTAVAMWNSDTYAYDASTDPLYASIPFLMVLRAGRAHGLLLDNSFRSFFDVGKESQSLLSFGAEDGELDYYFIDGPDPKTVLERYSALTGRMPLPPRWALGYHQSRYSYYPDTRVLEIARGFRERRIPADAIWLDIHYLDSYKPFSWDKERFPDPAALTSDLRALGFRLVTIVDPHPRKEPGAQLYESGLAADAFVKNPDGSVFEGNVWPSNAEHDPGPSVFPDFSKPSARDWWGGLLEPYLDAGVAGIWNDMNEPALFLEPAHTMPSDVRHDNEGQPTDHREIHNVYGLLNTRATFEGLKRLRPDARPFVLTRASFAGGQRYAAIWPGDNVSSWAQLAGSIPVLLGLGLSGFPFVGADIGGFAVGATPELYVRWLQLGVFYPFMRTHTGLGNPDQEPWSYGPEHEAINRRSIELRYELLPHVYSAMKDASDTGVPAMRPLFLEFPNDANTWALDDEFMFGRDLLVAPVLREQASQRRVYLPPGDWYDFWTGKPVEGGRAFEVPVTLDTLPIFVRAGAFLFRQPVVQHTDQMEGQPLDVYAYPAPASSASFYEDDGATTDATRVLRRRFAQTRQAGSVIVEVGAAEGPWRPQARELRLHVLGGAKPGRVLLNRSQLPRERWSVGEEGFVVVGLPDRFDAFRITLAP